MLVADKTLVDQGIIGDGSFYKFAGRRNPADAPKKVFAPRIGFAYRPFDDKTVIRGGYGLFYDSAEGREIDGSADIYPYVSRSNIQQTLTTTPPRRPTHFPLLLVGRHTCQESLSRSSSSVPEYPYVQR
jgi:hypothetical protein